MFYFMPTKVYCETDCVRSHAKELASFGKRALVVTGRRSAFKNGAIDDVRSALSLSGVDAVIFNEVEENPSVETVLKARGMALASGADFVIGIGGGSPMDAAKAVAVMMRRPDEGEDYLYDRDAATDAASVICIPTTCGTGSEVTSASVLSRHSRRAKGMIPHRVFPAISLLDPKYLMYAPRRVIVDTSMDALTHMYESYLNKNATVFSQMYVDAGLQLWNKGRRAILSNEPLCLDDCTNLLLASTLAGIAVAHAGTTLPHGLSYTLTYETGMPHGKACGYFLAGFLREAEPGAVSHLLKEAGFADLDSLKTYYRETCGRETVADDILSRSVQNALANREKLEQAPFPADESVLLRIAGIT